MQGLAINIVWRIMLILLLVMIIIVVITSYMPS